eukprot:353415-Chlamydomonas_euryale.AAC.5
MDGATDGVTDGVMDGATDGVKDGVTDGVTDGEKDGEMEGVTDGVTDGEMEGVTNGVTDGEMEGVTGVTDAAWRPLLPLKPHPCRCNPTRPQDNTHRAVLEVGIRQQPTACCQGPPASPRCAGPPPPPHSPLLAQTHRAVLEVGIRQQPTACRHGTYDLVSAPQQWHEYSDHLRGPVAAVLRCGCGEPSVGRGCGT